MDVVRHSQACPNLFGIARVGLMLLDVPKVVEKISKHKRIVRKQITLVWV